MAVEPAGPDPLAVQFRDRHANGERGAGGTGMARGLTPGLRLMAAAWPQYMAPPTSHQHRAASTELVQSRHGEANAAGAAAAEQGIAERPQQPSKGTG